MCKLKGFTPLDIKIPDRKKKRKVSNGIYAHRTLSCNCYHRRSHGNHYTGTQ